jgi:hypothetical protein
MPGAHGTRAGTEETNMKIGERSMMTCWRLGAVAAVVAAVVTPGTAAEAHSRERARSEGAAKATTPTTISRVDTVRLPYTRGKVYVVRLVPGAPFALELPAGEAAKNLWYDNRWWAAETTPTGSRVFIRALGSSDVVGRTGFMHVETDPSDLRISLRVEAVPDTGGAPAALEIYVEGSAMNDPAQRQMRKAFDRDLLYAQKQAEDRARAQFEAWRKGALTNGS